MKLHSKIGAAIAAFSSIGIVVNIILIILSCGSIDIRLINLSYCSICFALSIASFFCAEYISISIHLCSISIGAFLCFNTKDSYMYGSIILSLGVITAYSYGMFNTKWKFKVIALIILSWVFIAIACPEPFPQSAIIATGHTAFIMIFLYVLYTILRDKIDNKKIVEKRMLNAIDESEVLLSEAMEIIKEMNKKMRQGGSNGCE